MLSTWEKEVVEAYNQFCMARATGKKRDLKDLATDEFYKELAVERLENDLAVQWKAEDTKARIQTLRIAAISKPALNFAQMLVRFESRQTLQVLDKKQNVLAGSPEMRNVCEYLVVEKPLQDISVARWRFAGRAQLL